MSRHQGTSPGPFRGVLFDWDGTLVDSAATTYACYQTVLARFDIAFDEAAFRATYSPDWYRTYRALGLPEACWPEADRLWLSEYRRRETPLIPGVRNALEALRERGLLLGLVTAGEGGRVGRELERHGLHPYFETLVCAEELSRRKPAPDGLLLALERLGLSAAEAAYVGDSPEDVQMAQAAGVYAVGLPGGFPNRDSLAAAAPDLLAANLADAVAVLRG